MHLIKFTTNSNQEFINEPFKGSENKKKQQKVIKQSQLIEDFSYNVLKEFFSGLPTMEKFIEQKKKGEISQIIEFTSGKALFVSDLNEQEIKAKFKAIHQNQIKEANCRGSENIISFNYVTTELPANWQQMTYKELVEDINKLNPGYIMLETMFEELMVDRTGMHYKRESNESQLDKQNEKVINLLDVAVFDRNMVDEKYLQNRQSYTEQGDKIVYNKLLIYKIDLNNVGQLFENIKSKSLKAYSEISIKFFELIRIEYIQKQLDEQNLRSKCMFAAGDDIMIVARFDELEEIQKILRVIIDKINDMFNDSETKVTYAAGLQVVDYRLPIRLYYQEVEKALSYAKKDKSKNMIYFNKENYSEETFKQMIDYAMQIVWVEDRFKESSSVYYNLINHLITEKETSVGLTILNVLLNDNSDHMNVIGLFEEMINENYSAIGISNVIQLAIHISYLTSSNVEMKQQCNLEKIEARLKSKYQINDIIETFGTFVGFYDDLLKKSELELDSQEFADAIKNTIFRKQNNLYYQIKAYEKNIENFAKLNKCVRKNHLLACIMCSKIVKIKSEDIDEKN